MAPCLPPTSSAGSAMANAGGRITGSRCTRRCRAHAATKASLSGATATGFAPRSRTPISRKSIPRGISPRTRATRRRSSFRCTCRSARFQQTAFIQPIPTIDDLTDLFAEIGDTLALATRRFIAGYASAMRTKRRIPSDCELSKREVECLRWAAIGKTDREIGMIISLSHATVRYHVHRAGEKLNSVNRAQTIFKAGQLGYLGANS
jgi:DNA-binding CsgD family transcriptional regulator